MRRFLNFISREEDFTDKSLSDAESETEHSNVGPILSSSELELTSSSFTDKAVEDKRETAGDEPSITQQIEKLCASHSDLTDDNPLTDPLIPGKPKLPTLRESPAEHSSAHLGSSTQLSSQEPAPASSTSHVSIQGAFEDKIAAAVADKAESNSGLTENAKIEPTADISANGIEDTPCAHSEQTFANSLDCLSSFAQFDVNQVRQRKARLISFEELQTALKDLAEVMVWADKHDASLWDLFLEMRTMPTLVKCLHRTLSLEKDRVSQAAPNSVGLETSESVSGSTIDSSTKEAADILVQSSSIVQNKISNAAQEVTSAVDTTNPNENAYDSHPKSTGSTVESRVGNITAGEDKQYPDITEQKLRDVLFGLVPSKIQSQILQTISIIIQSVSKRHSLLCLFAANHINDVLSFQFSFDDDEMIASFVSSLKTITIRLDGDLLQLFFDPARNYFPLYDVVTQFFDHHESMVRIAIRNITLAIFALEDSEALKYIARDEGGYFSSTVSFLSRICGSVARAFELLLDDGMEVRRTRSRTGIFRRKVRVSEVTDRLEEIENICAYLNDVAVISEKVLRPVILRLTGTLFFAPFFRPLASLASPEAVRLRNKLWALRNREIGTSSKLALPLFDAAARCLLLSFVITQFRSSPVLDSLVRELSRPAADFDRRTVLHALKAMASNITGTERATFVSLCAIEAFVSSRLVDASFLKSIKYDFQVDESKHTQHEEPTAAGMSLLYIETPQRDDLDHSAEEPMLMTLSEFEAPFTPSNSIPTTPDLRGASSDGTLTPTVLSRATSSASLSSDIGSLFVERTDGDGILSSFQMGEVSLRDALSSIALVVRRREVRTMRVLYAISRIICAVAKRTHDSGMCVDISKIVLDELAGLMQSVLRDKRTTIVSIEWMFESFRTAAKSNQAMYSDAPKLEDILSPERAPLVASMFPKGAGKRRKASYDDAIPPIEIEDANTFFVMMYTYERALACAGITTLPKLTLQTQDILLEYGLEDSYLDKRDALENFAETVLQHGEIE
ncbi:Protein CLEC16A [Gracilariopsis chorda]|uniref:Protein CLEC16A n=1 Tax=Gracilariopsis chorda TaxID=448386 RepID=A0A2V3IK00_9FLOR|nr:Protein CLEC16A [Gracilariopsis chorda]|eukprot:PXF42402.1 Protein CLEC16A [Gracilariopsis chorda]